MTEPADDGEHPRAFLKVGGRTVAQHQLELALALECRRVVCVAQRMAPELTTLGDEATAGGAQLQIVGGARAVAAQINSTDELVVLAEGLLPQPRALLDLLTDGPAVLVQPIAIGLAAGFERVDADRASGGAMRVPGALAGRLNELPNDCDLVSALLRIALQAQVPIREIPEEARAGVRWKLLRGEAEAQAIESGWIAFHLGVGRGAMLSEKLARAAIGAFGSSLLHAGSNSRVLGFGVLALGGLALAAGWLGFGTVGFAFVALAVPLARGAALLARVEAGSLDRHRGRIAPARALAWLIDTVIVLLATWTGVHSRAAAFIPSAFPAVILIAIVRLLPLVLERRWSRWLADRALIALGLAFGAALGQVTDAVRLIATGLAIAALALTRRAES